jgi:hypothetical protein
VKTIKYEQLQIPYTCPDPFLQERFQYGKESQQKEPSDSDSGFPPAATKMSKTVLLLPWRTMIELSLKVEDEVEQSQGMKEMKTLSKVL